MEPAWHKRMSIDSASTMSLCLPRSTARAARPLCIRLSSTSVLVCHSQIRGSLMRNDRQIDVSFSANAEDVIRRFMRVAQRTMPNASLVPIINWWTEGTFTDKVTGKVTKLGPSIDVGAIDPKKLTDELIVPMGGLEVAIELPEELQSADRLKFDFLNGSFVVTAN
jgi:hypothetical protein